MQVLHIGSEPLAVVPYRTAVSGGGVADVGLPVLPGTVDVLPDGLDAILVASDLQGRAGHRLLGEQLADDVLARCRSGGLPPADRIGVVLAGDLYAAPRANQ